MAVRPVREDDVPIAVPWRITLALDVRALYGPEVDEACGVAEPAVDRWESGDERPTSRSAVVQPKLRVLAPKPGAPFSPERLPSTAAQLHRLAVLTEMPVWFFVEPAPEVDLGPVFVCARGM